MTNKELFDRFGGGDVRYIKKIGDSCWTIGEYVKLVGSADGMGQVLMARTDTVNAGTGKVGMFRKAEGYHIAPDLPDDTECWWASPTCFDWNDVIMPGQDYAQYCCRCGKAYESKKKHRLICGK